MVLLAVGEQLYAARGFQHLKANNILLSKTAVFLNFGFNSFNSRKTLLLLSFPSTGISGHGLGLNVKLVSRVYCVFSASASDGCRLCIV